jgi:hypothetical protein
VIIILLFYYYYYYYYALGFFVLSFIHPGLLPAFLSLASLSPFDSSFIFITVHCPRFHLRRGTLLDYYFCSSTLLSTTGSGKLPPFPGFD